MMKPTPLPTLGPGTAAPPYYRQRLARMALGLALLFALSACGGNDENTAATGNTTPGCNWDQSKWNEFNWC